MVSERDPKVYYENISMRGFFDFESSFQNCYWNLFSTSGLSCILKIKNIRKLPSLFSRNTLIPSSERTFWSLKTSFCNQNCPINSKTVMKIFSHEKLLCQSLNFLVLATPSKKSPKQWKPFRLKNFHDHFCNFWTIFLAK
jgi:hypothetical protein